jgi:recombinational DNA repair protein (RecF pathway)
MEIAPRVMRFEMVFLRELGYRPVLDRCAGCERALAVEGLVFSSEAGGVLCRVCQTSHREPSRRPISEEAWRALIALDSETEWRRPVENEVRGEIRHLLGGYITYLRGRQPRLLPYLGGG